MPGSVLAIFLGFCVIFVYYWRRKKPLPARPLNVDNDLPLPWLAQTSTVFSLTGLFGAYLGITVALGLPALLGLAVGTVLGLFIVLYWIECTLRQIPKKNQRFERFLSRILRGNASNAFAYALVISGIQCAFATSELLIFREIAEVGLGLKSAHANLIAIGLAVLGYCYVLWGGYIALFRTDMVQLILVCLMAVGCSVLLITRHSEIAWTTARLWPRSGFWEVSLLGSGPALYLYHFLIATIMGLGLFLASPDTWKRVFQVNKDQAEKGRSTTIFRTLTLLAVGILPYLVLLPIAIAIGTKSEAIVSAMGTADSQVKRRFTLPPALYDIRLFVLVSLGLVASFLSSFNSALLGSVHISLIWTRRIAGRRAKTTPRIPEEAQFYRIIMTVLGCICILFIAERMLAWIGFKNPWLLGNLIMGGYSLIAGIHIGTRGKPYRLPKYGVQAICVSSLVIWMVYFGLSPGFSASPTIRSVNTVPPAVFLCLVIAFVSWLMVRVFGGGKDVRSHGAFCLDREKSRTRSR